LVLAEDEDRWDSIVRQFSGVDGRKPDNWKGSPVRESLWRDAIVEALVVVKAALEREKELNRVMAEKMQGVVDRETALAEKERHEREESEESESAKLAVCQKTG
jgi:leucyl aminopeptidase (aminopeptidase T)